MKSFSILAIAALAYTANADKMKAQCKVESDTGKKLGKINIIQEINVDKNGDGINEVQPSIINFGARGLESNIIHDFMILENDGVNECLFASVDTPLYEGQAFMSSRRGMVSGRGLVDRDLNIDLSLDGQFAALVDDLDMPVACCVLEVTECLDDDEEVPDQN